MLVSVVIRTLNEEKHLAELLSSIDRQELGDLQVEKILIDSGSTDGTLEIAERHGCRVFHIGKHEFTFGRSLNWGSKHADGEILVYISGHCVPESSAWLSSLIGPVRNGVSAYSYGRQVGRDTTKFSETKIFEKYYPETSRIPQAGFFCNNANSAIARSAWEQYQFDEDVTGLEDMELAKRITDDGGEIAYVADAVIFHIHDESWAQTKRRYERESIALQKIMPEVHISVGDMLRYFFAGVTSDLSDALAEKRAAREFIGILKFRSAQYWGTYRGNHEHRVLSRKRKENYYYPSKIFGESDE